MADDLRMALAELLRKADLDGDVDFLREGVRLLAQQLMELEVAQHLGAERYERTAERTGERNGYRERSWDTRVGSLELVGIACADPSSAVRPVGPGSVGRSHRGSRAVDDQTRHIKRFGDYTFSTGPPGPFGGELVTPFPLEIPDEHPAATA